MDMTKEAIEQIIGMDAPHEIDYAGRKFIDKEMSALPREITADPLETNTLTSIIDYIQSDADAKAIGDSRFVIHVAGHGSVDLYKELNQDKTRDHLIHAEIERNRFPFGQFISIEQFNINVQSLFVQNDNTKALLEFIGSVKDDSTVKQLDDGVTQRVEAASGVSLTKSVHVPNPVMLRPFRTFAEIDQPESAFVFRMRKDENRGVTAALFEADGAAWKHESIITIRQYLEDMLQENGDIIILA